MYTIQVHKQFTTNRSSKDDVMYTRQVGITLGPSLASRLGDTVWTSSTHTQSFPYLVHSKAKKIAKKNKNTFQPWFLPLFLVDWLLIYFAAVYCNSNCGKPFFTGEQKSLTPSPSPTQLPSPSPTLVGEVSTRTAGCDCNSTDTGELDQTILKLSTKLQSNTCDYKLEYMHMENHTYKANPDINCKYNPELLSDEVN